MHVDPSHTHLIHTPHHPTYLPPRPNFFQAAEEAAAKKVAAEQVEKAQKGGEGEKEEARR